jgi:DNA-directed RNA polymerase alpha subunit
MKPDIQHILPLSINHLKLTEKEASALKMLNVCTFSDIFKIKKYDFIKIKGFGRTSLNKLVDKFAEYAIVIPN